MPLSQNNQACIRDLSNNGNSLVNSEMGNPWSTYVPLSIHSCWFRMMTHRPTGFRALSGAHPLRPNTGQTGVCTLRSLDSCLESNRFRYIHLLPFPYQTPSSLQHVATLPNPQHLYLDSLYSPLPNWSGHPQFHIYKNWCRFKQHASKLQHNTNIYKTINSDANLHPCLGSP